MLFTRIVQTLLVLGTGTLIYACVQTWKADRKNQAHS